MPAIEDETPGSGGANEPKYHRVESQTQTRDDAKLQVSSGEVWGRPARGSSIPSVKAYRNALPQGRRGIEFTTPVSSTPGSGTPYEARWYFGNTPGVRLTQKNGEDFAVISATVINMQP